MADSLTGVWVDGEGRVHTTVANLDGSRETRVTSFRPFAWLTQTPVEIDFDGVNVERLAGESPFNRLVHADDFSTYERFIKQVRGKVSVDAIRPIESQFLLQARERLFRDMTFGQVRRCQMDIECASSDDGLADPTRPEDRVLAIGLRVEQRNRILMLEEMTDTAEKTVLESFNAALAEEDPDVIEGHNISTDLDYLRQRCRRLKVPCAWGRYDQKAKFRSSRLKVAERSIDFLRCDLAGRSIVDTYLLVQLYDITTRELISYGLKEVAAYFGITEEGSLSRTDIEGQRIQDLYRTDPGSFRAHLEDGLSETRGLADQLVPTYFEQVRTFPTLLQEATLRGATSKIDLLFLEEYYHARQACPIPPEVQPFEGGYTRSFQEGVFRHVLHFDVASLYPSLLLYIARNPKTDTLGVFIPLLRRLREYRLVYKQLARNAPTEEERSEAQARQTNFKILINSFYGYLGFSGARFGDGELAAEVTRRGRELLQSLIDEFAKHGCTILEADTDGIYLSSAYYHEKPAELLALVETILPEGIELEHDGSYQAMWCYKAKNYALYDGEKITLRGSALRSRGIEPFLKKLSDQLITFLLGAATESPLALVESYRSQLQTRTLPVVQLAKSETLNQNPGVYERLIAEGGKPRRASAEVALQLSPRPRMGDRVTYYVTARTKGRTSDWQRARALALYNADIAPYDPAYYIEKLDDWLARYGTFLGLKPAEELPTGVQGELF